METATYNYTNIKERGEKNTAWTEKYLNLYKIQTHKQGKLTDYQALKHKMYRIKETGLHYLWNRY